MGGIWHMQLPNKKGKRKRNINDRGVWNEVKEKKKKHI